MKSFGILSVFLVASTALGQFDSQGRPYLRFRTVMTGEQCRVKRGEQHVFMTEGDFQRYWGSAMGDVRTAPQNIDWGKEFVIGVNLGTQKTAGYQLSINGMEWSGGDVVVRVGVLEPNPRGFTAQVETSPFTLIAVERVAMGNIVFDYRRRTNPSFTRSHRWDDCEGWTDIPCTPWCYVPNCGYSTEQTFYFGSLRDIESYGAQVFGWDSLPAGLAKIDWSTESLVAIHHGAQNSSRITVEAKTDGKKQFVIKYADQVTGEMKRAGTSAVTIIRVPKKYGVPKIVRG